MRLTLHDRLERLRIAAPYIAQAGLASALAWLAATELVGHDQPFFAPISSLIVLGLAAGQRNRRALETAFAVALGIAVGDLLVNLIGGGTWQLLVVVPLAMAVAIVLGGSAPVITQTGISTVLVVIFEQPEGFSFTRTVDVIVGAAAALLISFVVLPIDPLALIRREAAPVLREMAETLEDIAAALDARDPHRTAQALLRARSADPLAQAFGEALTAGRQTAVAAVQRRKALPTIDLYGQAGEQLDLAVRNVRVIARGAMRAIDVGDSVPPDATMALRSLAQATRGVESWLNDPVRVGEAREPAIRAAQRAGAVLDQTANLSVSVIVGAIRGAAVDVLRGTGLPRDEALRLVRG